MALYCAESPLSKAEGFAFQEEWRPGAKPMLPGLYRCLCGLEVPLPSGDPLPAAHRHQPSQGPIGWRLIVMAEEPAVVAIPARARLVDAPPRANGVRDDAGHRPTLR